MRNAPARSAALSYAASGWAVFPAHGIHAGRCTCGRPQCASPGKHPLTRRGLHDATTDGAVVRTWWGRWRFANVAVATGRASGIAVVDLDLPSAAGSFGDLVERLPSTLTALTGGGGVDLLYACDRSLGNSTGRLPGHPGALPGVDLRSDGGYIVAPPSSHLSSQRYSWLDPGATLASLPDWISEETPRGGDGGGVCRPQFQGDGSPYGQCSLRDEVARLSDATIGRRNHELNRAAFSVAQLVAGGELLEAPARAALAAEGIRIGLTEREVAATIASAFRAGSGRPRGAPHRLGA